MMFFPAIYGIDNKTSGTFQNISHFEKGMLVLSNRKCIVLP